MGGFFGVASRRDCVEDVFFGTDYHSHLGTYCGGMATFDEKLGLQRDIHSIRNAPFRTRFKGVFDEMSGTSGIGCISDTSPQPLLITSRLGTFAICFIGMIRNLDALVARALKLGCHFDAMTGGTINPNELLAALINEENGFADGIRAAQEQIEGTASILILCEDGSLIAARDRLGRLPVIVGKSDEGHAVAMETFAFQKLGYEYAYELGPGEILRISPEGCEQLSAPRDEMRVCAFLWSYYGYPTSSYEKVNVEAMRYRNGASMAEADKERGALDGIDYVGGIPDSGTPHAIGFAARSGIPFARAFIKYTPTWQRSFMPNNQDLRNEVARMKLILVHEFVEGKNLLFVDDSIVRGTQLRQTVRFLFDNGAGAVHMRSACPPILFGCKYLNFSRETSDDELLARRIITELEGEEGSRHLDEYADPATQRCLAMRRCICEKFAFDSLAFQSVEGIVGAIGLPTCKLCTYCWNGIG